MTVPLCRLASLVLACQAFLAAQPADDTQLKQVILFGRHGVRTPNSPNSVLNNFSVQPFPVFPDVPGYPIPTDNQPSILTNNGAANETLLGGYFRLWLTQEGLLTGNDAADAANVYFRADGAPLITGTAQAFAAGLLPAATVTVNSILPLTSDALFDPIDAGVALLNQQMAAAAVNGRLGANPQALTSAYSAELSLIRSVLFDYPAGQTPAPAAPAGKLDVTAVPISVTAGIPALPVNLGGLETVATAIDPFVMEYADGLPASQVAWGQLTADGISQVFRVYDRLLDLEFRTPYLARVQSSNLASHIVRSLVQASTGSAMTGTLGNPSSKVIALIGSNTNIEGFAGLFHLDWLLPGYQADVAAPGGILRFELRQSQSTGEYIVRISYVAQTMDQLRNRTALTLAAPPPSAPVFIPGCSLPNATLDCPLAKFVAIANQVIDPHSADLMN
ncbi:MAG TPA: histidine-type phosphatase [Bryobacteraceae bacterium]|nr:histidine-type phosphatase [Bryobacteraceae bacterium]